MYMVGCIHQISNLVYKKVFVQVFWVGKMQGGRGNRAVITLVLKVFNNIFL